MLWKELVSEVLKVIVMCVGCIFFSSLYRKWVKLCMVLIGWLLVLWNLFGIEC